MPDDDRGSDGESDDDDDDDDDEEDDDDEADSSQKQNGSSSLKLSACPNLRNPYHECTSFCAKKWGSKQFIPDQGEFAAL